MKFQEIILAFIIPFISSAVIVPLVKGIAVMIGAVDKPNERKVHSNLMPRLGGLAIFIAFIVGVMIFHDKIIGFADYGLSEVTFSNYAHMFVSSRKLTAIIIASLIIIFVGLIDDISEINARFKLGGQIVAALVIVLYGGIVLEPITIFGLTIDLSILSAFLSIFWIIGIMNSINLIDGLDGLASGISSIYFLTIAIIAIYGSFYDPVISDFRPLHDAFTAFLSVIMLGGTLGFLIHNFHPAKIFLGDTGSLFLGLIVAVLPLLGFKGATFIVLVIPLTILAVPVLDVFFAIVRRAIRGDSFSTADRQHIHHQLYDRDFGHRKTVLLIYFITALFSSAALIFTLYDQQLGIILFSVLSLLVLIFVEVTSVLSEDFKPITSVLGYFKTRKNRPKKEKKPKRIKEKKVKKQKEPKKPKERKKMFSKKNKKINDSSKESGEKNEN